MNQGIFKGRTIQIVNDLSVDEQIYLYEKTRDLKESLRSGKDLDRFRINDSELAVYLMFLEDSTRTKESFRNAAIFHRLKVNDFDAKTSSFQKKENLTDTVKMLMGYSQASMFVVRSKQEGVCRWLERSMSKYAQKAGIPKPSFINAGDGRHEHPSQEFLDEFSFLERLDWKRDHIHIALVGDLFHGRTVHSKVDGLRIFKEVEVDLIAPQEIAMPEHYHTKMEKLQFRVRRFASIDEYLAQKKVAPLWYFTRLQLERMGEKLLKQTLELRHAVSFRPDHLEQIDPNSRFFHPLPRHSETPTIPTFLDDTSFNAWDEQSRNGYFTRIIEIAMLGGRLGRDFSGQSVEDEMIDQSFIEEAPIRTKAKPEYKIGIRPVEKGLVVDHIGIGLQPRQIWELITKIREILDLNVISSQGVFKSAHSEHYKGIISIPEMKDLDYKKTQMLAAISPGATVNVIKDHEVNRKYRLHTPSVVSALPGLRCRNQDCISNPDFYEPVVQEFRTHPGQPETYFCQYCNTPHSYREIWAD